MKHFVGTKRVSAIPMNRLEYNQYREWELPSDENGEDEGYLVEYVDGGQSNHPKHEGYISWSPKEQFDNAYIEEKGTLFTFDKFEAPHQDRVAVEANELEDKLNKLYEFINSNPIFEKIDENEQRRLKLQHTTMSCYYSILVDRINNFK